MENTLKQRYRTMKIELANRLNDINEYYFSKKLDQIREMKNNGMEVINLGIGSPEMPPPEEIINMLISSVQNPGHHAYQPYRSIKELRTAMCKFYQNIYGVELDPDQQILPLMGSKEGILYTSLILLNPGDKVLIPDPGYPIYQSVARMIGAKVIKYDLLAKNQWKPDLSQLETMDLSGVKLMWMNYPNMPTGAVLDDSFYVDVIKFTERNNIILCNDNPYSLVLSKKPKSLLQYARNSDHLIELNSLSKAYNMAGWRVGMAVSSSEIISSMIKVKSNVDSGMFLPIQHAAVTALNLPDDWHLDRNNKYLERREIVIEILKLLNCPVEDEQEGLFLWAKIPRSFPDAMEFTDMLLNEHHLFITPGSILGKNGARYIRVSLCASVKNLNKALARIESKMEIEV